MRLSPWLPAVLRSLSLLASLTPAVTFADFTLVSQSAVYDPSTSLVTFTVQFNQAPDFTITDGLGRQADSFQYYVFGDRSAPYPGNYDSIVRGEELHLSGNELRIRNSVPPVQNPAAGGWGSVRGTVPFTLNGDILSFSAPLPLLSEHNSDGDLTYLVSTLEFGTQTGILRGETTTGVTPEPSGLVLLATGFVGSMAVFRRRLR